MARQDTSTYYVCEISLKLACASLKMIYSNLKKTLFNVWTDGHNCYFSILKKLQS